MGFPEDQKLPLLDQNLVSEDGPPRRRKSGGLARVVTLYGSCFALAFLLSVALHGGRVWSLFQSDSSSGHAESTKKLADSCDDPVTGYQCDKSRSQLWGQYSPYFSVPSEIPDELPHGCEITFAQILSRHGARAPTLKRTLKYSSTIVRIQSTVTELTGKYEFLRNYRYSLGADQLNEFGRNQLRYSGAKFYERYKHLTRANTPFVRTSGQRRVVESADAWIEGFHQAKKADKDSDKDQDYPYSKVLINEGPGFNNTLCHGLCVNIEEGPLSRVRVDAKDAWINIYGPPILSRLRKDLPEADLAMVDLHSLMSMCPFDTVNTPEGTISPFCDLFTDDEWQQYNQLENIEKFYGWGKGNPLGPTQGVGFANELIARMTHTPVDDHTTTNSTLDSDPKTFPIDKKHKLFADFSHDNDLTAAFYALGLYNSTPMLSISQVDSIYFTKGWSSAWTVPFAARAYFEKMKCSGRDEELVRVIVNDRVVPMETCGADELGRCTLSNFENSLTFAKQGGHWDSCFEDVMGRDFQLPSERFGVNATPFDATMVDI